MKPLLAWLRSPKLALGLAIVIAAHSFVGTLVPQEDASSEAFAAWQATHTGWAPVVRTLGLNAAYSSPFFLALIMLLFAATVACAWARTAAARRVVSSATGGTLPSASSLSARGSWIAGPLDHDGRDRTMELAESSLRSAGYAVFRKGDVLRAGRRAWSAWGSPVFHWALALLVVAIVAGQLSRAEGRLPVPVDDGVTEAAENYDGRIERGPFFPGHTGLTLSARDFQTRTLIDGIDRGATALLELKRGDATLAEGRVYPNAPLRYGPLLIHPDTWGYAPLLAIETTEGVKLAQEYGRIPESDVTSAGAGPGLMRLSIGPGGPIEIAFSIPAEPSSHLGGVTLQPAIAVSIQRAGEPAGAPVLLKTGERAPLFGGLWIRFVRGGEYVRVAVANDRSVPFIYALFGIAAAGLTLALLVRPRTGWVYTEERDGAWYVGVAVARPVRDPSFAERFAALAVGGQCDVPGELGE